MAIGGSVGLLVGLLALLVPQARIHQPVSQYLPDEAVAFGGGYNIVNVILVDVRAWDTLGEIAVLLAAATGIASLTFIGRRTTEAYRLPANPDDAIGTVGSSDPDPMASVRAPASIQNNVVASRMPWLAGSVTLAPQRRSVILEVATRILYHNMVVFSLFLLFSGHNLPGGGFVAGLVTGIALIIRYLAGGRYELGAAAPLQPGVVLGTGLVVSAASGLVPTFFGGEVFQSAILETVVPLFGDVKLVTSVFFDIGVYLVVVGMMLDILKSLGAEVDRQGETTGHDSDLVRPEREPLHPLRRHPR